MSQVSLPDGMSVFGNLCPGSKSFDFEHMNDDGAISYRIAVKLSKHLKMHSVSSENRDQRFRDIIESYDFLVSELYKLTPETVNLFEEILATGTIYGTPISIPPQPARAANYYKIAHWRVFRDSNRMMPLKPFVLNAND